MKKLYLFLTLFVCLAFAAKADNTFVFDLTIDNPDEVSVVWREYSYSGPGDLKEEVKIEKGKNHIERTMIDEGWDSEYLYLCIEAKEGYILKIHDNKKDGAQNFDVKNNTWSQYISGSSYYWYDKEYDFTVKTFDETTFRNRSVKVTIDDPEGLRLELRGNTAFNPTETEYIIPYNDEYEDRLSVRCIDADNIIYKITADGNEVKRDQSDYPIVLVDRSDADDIKYVEEVVITQNFPADATGNVKIIFTNGDPGCIKTITYNNEPVTDYASEDGFTVNLGKKLYIEFDTDNYRMISYQKDDQKPYESSYISIVSQVIGQDFTLKVTAEKYVEMTATIILEDPSTVKVCSGSYPYPQYEMVAGENTITFTNKQSADQITVEAVDGYEISRIYDKKNDKEIPVSTYSSKTYIYLEEDGIYEVSTTKISRDKFFVIYVDDLTAITDPFVSVSRGGNILKGEVGYNLFDYRDKDGLISIGAYGASSESQYYRNEELMEISYYSYFSIKDLGTDEVIKMFFVPENAVHHTVTFEMNEGTLDGYEVKKDILAAVDPTEPVSAIGKTQFTIAPVAREGSDLTVTIGDKTIEPVDGIYTFETEGDTTVKVSNPTSGIENVICGENQTADVYNLQGIRVARQANAADVKALPAGIYVVNGQKVLVK